MVREGGMVTSSMVMGEMEGPGMFLEWKKRKSALLSLKRVVLVEWLDQ